MPTGFLFDFNRQEKDNEVSGVGNSYTAEFWQYDPRLGRRFNLDPKPNPSISVYACFANNPLFFADPDGDTLFVGNNKGTSLVALQKMVAPQYRNLISLAPNPDGSKGTDRIAGAIVQLDKSNLTQADFDGDPGLALLNELIDGNDQNGNHDTYNYFYEVNQTTPAVPTSNLRVGPSEVPVPGTLQATNAIRSPTDPNSQINQWSPVPFHAISGQAAINPNNKFYTEQNKEIPVSTMTFLELYSVWYQVTGRAIQANFLQPYHESKRVATSIANTTYKGVNNHIFISEDRTVR